MKPYLIIVIVILFLGTLSTTAITAAAALSATPSTGICIAEVTIKSKKPYVITITYPIGGASYITPIIHRYVDIKQLSEGASFNVIVGAKRTDYKDEIHLQFANGVEAKLIDGVVVSITQTIKGQIKTFEHPTYDINPYTGEVWKDGPDKQPQTVVPASIMFALKKPL